MKTRTTPRTFRWIAVLVTVATSMLPLHAQGIPAEDGDPLFYLGWTVGPLSVQTINLYPQYDNGRVVDLAGSMQLGLLAGIRALDFGNNRALYVLAAPYYYEYHSSSLHINEKGIGLDAVYFGKPFLLGIDLPLYAGGVRIESKEIDGATEVSGEDYEVSIGDIFQIKFLIGANGRFKEKALFSDHLKDERFFGAITIALWPYGPYAYVSQFGLLGGRTF